MLHPFRVLEPEYRQRLNKVRITRQALIHRRVVQLSRQEVIDHFVPAHKELGIPLVWMIASFERESSSDFTRSPAQGDRFDRISTHVPRGVGPFKSFEEAALWSYRHDGLNRNSASWDMAYACYAWEKFNGFGPRAHGRVSGYVWAGTNQYDPPEGKGGKYVGDGDWSPGTVDQQLGCLPLALELIKLVPSLAFGDIPVPVEAIDPIPLVPVPEGYADALWVQQILNKLKVEGTPLIEDNSYGRRTRNVVKVFQREHPPLDDDGLVGPSTRAAMQKVSEGVIT